MLYLLFSLLLITSMPQVHSLIPIRVTIGPLDIYWFDLFTAAAFVHWLFQPSHAKNASREFSRKVNKLYVALLLVGLISIVVGYINGKDNLLNDE